MSFINEIEPDIIIDRLKEQLKEMPEIEKPAWANFVKTSSGKQRPPLNDDWWESRTASVLRKVAVKGPIGVSKLRTKYGTRKNKGYAPEKFTKASGKIIRVILQQLEEAKLIQQTEKGVHKGRVVTPKGNSLIDKTVLMIKKEQKEAPQDGKE